MKIYIINNNLKSKVERVTGIEPVTEAWEAFVIPFHHTRAGPYGVIARPGVVKLQSARSAPPACSVTAAGVVVDLRDCHDALQVRERFDGIGNV